MTTYFSHEYIDQPGITDETIYTSPANTVTRIAKCTVTNDAAGAATITFNKVPLAGTAGDTNLILKDKAIGGYETYDCPEVVGQILNASGFLSAKASDADQLTVSLDVVKVV